MLYRTGVEYGDYTMNHVLGCAHGCTYPCYAYMMKKRFGQVRSYEEWCNPVLVENTLELLDKELPRLKHNIKSVHLCFSTDPFMYEYPQIRDMSIASIQRINEEGIPCTVLTKGVLPKRLAYLSRENFYGITLVSLSRVFRQKYECGAAPIGKRIKALLDLHNAGCKTWVSIEPYPTPNIHNQNLRELLEAVKFVDKIIFGRMNYNKLVSQYKENKVFYNKVAKEVTDFCKIRHKDYHIKDGTITEI